MEVYDVSRGGLRKNLAFVLRTILAKWLCSLGAFILISAKRVLDTLSSKASPQPHPGILRWTENMYVFVSPISPLDEYLGGNSPSTQPSMQTVDCTPSPVFAISMIYVSYLHTLLQNTHAQKSSLKVRSILFHPTSSPIWEPPSHRSLHISKGTDMKLPILHVWQWHLHSGEEQKPGIAFSSKETDLTVKRGTDLDSNPSGTYHSQIDIDMLVPVREEACVLSIAEPGLAKAKTTQRPFRINDLTSIKKSASDIASYSSVPTSWCQSPSGRCSRITSTSHLSMIRSA